MKRRLSSIREGERIIIEPREKRKTLGELPALCQESATISYSYPLAGLVRGPVGGVFHSSRRAAWRVRVVQVFNAPIRLRTSVSPCARSQASMSSAMRCALSGAMKLAVPT